MTFAEFHAAVGRIAAGRYYSTEVKATTHEARAEVSLTWGGYISEHPAGWVILDAPDAVLAVLASPQVADVRGVDPLPATEPPGEPAS